MADAPATPAPEQQPAATPPPEQVAAQPAGKPTMAVKIYAPFEVFYEGQAYSLSGVNAVGPFDVLPHHHNFLSILSPCTIIVKDAEGETKVKVSRALMHVKADRVVVFVDV